jgi:hypothetical protein
MKPRYALVAALATSSLVALAAAPEKLPPQWLVTGPTPAKYASGIDQADDFRGAKFIRSTTEDARTWGALTQMIAAQNYLGQRIRFRARIRTEEVTGWAGLWLRVDRAGKPVGFYNSMDKPIKGSTGWQERSVVLDVPLDADAIAFGVIDNGKGQVWIDALSLEPVGQEVPVDRMPGGPTLPLTPSL